MTYDMTPVIIALITVIGGTLVGIAALRKAGSEASKLTAEATGQIVGSAGNVVKLMRDELDALLAREDTLEARIVHLETVVEGWEGWGDRVVDLIDDLFRLLTTEQQSGLADAVRDVKSSRPLSRREH